jgi:hypothetical protein
LTAHAEPQNISGRVHVPIEHQTTIGTRGRE